MNLDTITHLLALAAGLEREGQYNNAKLLRASTDSLLTRAAYQVDFPTDKSALLAETDRAIAALAGLDLRGSGLAAALKQARAALADGGLSRNDETPDPYVCRICGYLIMGEPTLCPTCGAQPSTFKRFRAIYWLEALDPYSALDHLRSTPVQVAGLLERVTDQQANHSPEASAWSLQQVVAHLRDAQGVLAFRVDLILNQDNPVLESKAVFEWAANEAPRPKALQDIFETYRVSRAQTVTRLEQLPLSDWWRRGRHEEFGELRLYQQVSYFASHELTHLPQIASLTQTLA